MVVWPSGLRRLIQESLSSSPQEAGVLRYRKMQEFESLSNHHFSFSSVFSKVWISHFVRVGTWGCLQPPRRKLWSSTLTKTLVYAFCVWESTYSIRELLAHLSPLTVRENKDSDTELLQRKCTISKGGRDRTYVGWHSILTLRTTVTGLNKMANINGNIYPKPCERFKKELLTKWIEHGTYLPRGVEQEVSCHRWWGLLLWL